MDQDELKIARYTGSLRRHRVLIVTLALLGGILGGILGTARSSYSSTVSLSLDQQTAIALGTNVSDGTGRARDSLPFSTELTTNQLRQWISKNHLDATIILAQDKSAAQATATGPSAAEAQQDANRIAHQWTALHKANARAWAKRLSNALLAQRQALTSALDDARSDQSRAVEAGNLAVALVTISGRLNAAEKYPSAAAEDAETVVGAATPSGISPLIGAILGAVLFALLAAGYAIARAAWDKSVRSLRQLEAAQLGVPCVMAPASHAASRVAWSALPAGPNVGSVCALPVDPAAATHTAKLEVDPTRVASLARCSDYLTMPPSSEELRSADAVMIAACWGSTDLAGVRETVRYAKAHTNAPVSVVVLNVPANEWLRTLS